jgi:hypothetical protein
MSLCGIVKGLTNGSQTSTGLGPMFITCCIFSLYLHPCPKRSPSSGRTARIAVVNRVMALIGNYHKGHRVTGLYKQVLRLMPNEHHRHFAVSH